MKTSSMEQGAHQLCFRYRGRCKAFWDSDSDCGDSNKNYFYRVKETYLKKDIFTSLERV